jgi:hypothetical protein
LLVFGFQHAPDLLKALIFLALDALDEEFCGYRYLSPPATFHPDFNFVFTRIVNDLLHHHGTSGDLSSVGNEGGGASGSLEPTLKVAIEMPLGKKTSLVQYVRTIRPTLPAGQEHVGNQVLLTTRR